MDTQSLLPQSKSDNLAVQRLRALPGSQVAVLADELLKWLRDGNWPIAADIGDLLAPHVATIEASILAVFRGTDDLWKYWTIYMVLGSASPTSFTPAILDELKRMAYTPTTAEREDCVDEAARAILARFGFS